MPKNPRASAGAVWLGDMLGFGPSRMDATHSAADVTLSDTLNEGRMTSGGTTAREAAVFAHPVLGPSVELVGFITLGLFLLYMEKRIRVLD